MDSHEGLAGECDRLFATNDDSERLELLTKRYENIVGFSPFKRKEIRGVLNPSQ